MTRHDPAAMQRAATPIVDAVLQIRAGQTQAAQATLRAILRQDPHNTAALMLLSTAALREGDARRATDLARRAVALAPADPRAQATLAAALAATGETAAAITAWRRALARDPGFAAGHCNLGQLLLGRDAPAEAWAACDTALAINPTLPAARLNRGLAAIRLGRLEQGEADLRAAVASLPESPDVWLGLGEALRRMGRHDEAVAALRKVLALDPGHAAAHNALGSVHRAAGRYDAAIACFDRALALKPDCDDARWNRAVANLLAGRLAEAWDDHEARWRLPGMQPLPSYPKPMWQGEPIAGRTILLSPEQGLGDAIQFVRYVPLLAARGARVVLCVQPELAGLMQALQGASAIVTPGQPLPDFDVFCPLLSLPRAFRTHARSIPAPVPYLAAAPGAVARWRGRIAQDGTKSVGIVWAGNPRHANDHNRSLPLPALGALAAVPGVRLYSLQVGPRAVEATSWSALTDLSPHLTDFTETAAALSALDLLITVDTSVAHLAGALARPVWLMLAHEPDWRWIAERADTPWYPTAKLFRQQRFGDWSAPVRAVADALRAFAVQPVPQPVDA